MKRLPLTCAVLTILIGLVAFVAPSAQELITRSGGSAEAVLGPSAGTSTDNAVMRWDGTDGRRAQNSVVLIGDTGAVTGVTTLNATTGINVGATNVAVALGQEFVIDSTVPGMVFYDSNAAADQKFWQIQTQGGVFQLMHRLDNGGNPGGSGFAYTATVDANGDIARQTLYSVFSGASVERDLIEGASKALTEGAATSVVQIAVDSDSSVGATVEWTVCANDATDRQCRRGRTYLAAVNKAGTETCTVGDVGTTVVAVSAGTLTVASGCSTSPSNAVDFTLDATSSLTQTSLTVTYRVVRDHGGGAITPQ